VKLNSIKRSLLVALAAGSVTFGAMTAGTSGAGAATSYRVSVPGGVNFEFQSSPRWVAVPGTRVYRIRDDMRPNEDFYRYGNSYYVYSGGSWYRANRWNGRYVLVNERNLPAQFYDIPENNWRSYPVSWRDHPRGHGRRH
jgi:hypothetical protein